MEKLLDRYLTIAILIKARKDHCRSHFLKQGERKHDALSKCNERSSSHLQLLLLTLAIITGLNSERTYSISSLESVPDPSLSKEWKAARRSSKSGSPFCSSNTLTHRLTPSQLQSHAVHKGGSLIACVSTLLYELQKLEKVMWPTTRSLASSYTFCT